MQFPKSTPDLDNPTAGRRNSRRRESRKSRASRQGNMMEMLVTNPFRGGEEENCLPLHLRSQLEQMDYISSKSIKNIQFPQTNRRTSNFQKNLLMMQQLAQRQEEKFTRIKDGPTFHEHYNCVSFSPVMDERPLNLNDDDLISLELNGFYDEKERLNDDFNMFKDDMDEQEPIHFYSNQQLQQDQCMDEEVSGYFG